LIIDQLNPPRHEFLAVDREPAQPTRIGIAVVEHQGRYLVGTRGEGRPLPGYAEFPGGKCHADETPAAAANRECFEETGLRIEIIELLLEREFDYPHGRVDLSFVLCCPAPGSDVTQMRGSFRWVAINELPHLKFPDANAPVIDKLVERARPNAQSGFA